MARIVVITHETDVFLHRRGLLMRKTSHYLIFDVLQELRRRGHEIVLQQGLANRAFGDVAVLHVDATVTPPDYVDYARSFPLCLNVTPADISKRAISGALLSREDGWPGPVIVKTDLNHSGFAERRHNRHAQRAGKPAPFPDAPEATEYEVYEGLDEVPAGVFGNPDLIVERFIPEPEPDGYAMRFWVFCGSESRCTRYVSPQRMVKAKDTIRREPVMVPEEMQALRKKLGFDYGKFDFVMHEGKAVLLDANKTPGRPLNLLKMFVEGAPLLANGFEEFIRCGR
jgi:hypothetical protein